MHIFLGHCLYGEVPLFYNLIFMNLPAYPIFVGGPFMYQFFSEGPHGKIKKAVLYAPIEDDIFNLGFGDWDDNLGRINDSNRTNNNDRDRVLATVALTTIDFTNRFPNISIFAEGTTPARNRLYQMGISANFLEINKYFKVLGFVREKWQPFRPELNYEAFLIQRR